MASLSSDRNFQVKKTLPRQKAKISPPGLDFSSVVERQPSNCEVMGLKIEVVNLWLLLIAA